MFEKLKEKVHMANQNGLKSIVIGYLSFTRQKIKKKSNTIMFSYVFERFLSPFAKFADQPILISLFQVTKMQCKYSIA